MTEWTRIKCRNCGKTFECKSRTASTKYHKGWLPIPNTRWKVFIISEDGLSFIEIGKVFVSGKEVSKEMDEHQSIKGYEAYDVAQKIAHKKYPKANPIMVEQIYEE